MRRTTMLVVYTLLPNTQTVGYYLGQSTRPTNIPTSIINELRAVETWKLRELMARYTIKIHCYHFVKPFYINGMY